MDALELARLRNVRLQLSAQRGQAVMLMRKTLEHFSSAILVDEMQRLQTVIDAAYAAEDMRQWFDALLAWYGLITAITELASTAEDV